MSVTPGRPRDPEVDRRIAQAALDLFADAGWAADSQSSADPGAIACACADHPARPPG